MLQTNTKSNYSSVSMQGNGTLETPSVGVEGTEQPLWSAVLGDPRSTHIHFGCKHQQQKSHENCIKSQHPWCHEREHMELTSFRGRTRERHSFPEPSSSVCTFPNISAHMWMASSSRSAIFPEVAWNGSLRRRQDSSRSAPLRTCDDRQTHPEGADVVLIFS